ncbi:TIGR02452 family protein [Deinococcus indicus]|uniref:TIGR02452 family protein n=1 Tax=Deinococcus indicus TaxID=223556 RepID=A0A246BE01_9DEIO|nr:TIGR02452 family protein [Deinococcus indicus]OWL93185.1 TIGR02452 family protein [Deinococcus indicus]OWL93438.1 TIGR02452 family protein [Deinococcus indicus]
MPPLDRTKLIQDAHSTLAALSARGYDGPRGHVDLTLHLARQDAGTRLYTPEHLRAAEQLLEPGPHDTRFAVTRETTLAATRRLLGERPGPVSALNFASATSTGGGFLTGSAAQEESLCRASGLYAALSRAPEYYEGHRARRDRLYTDQLMFAQDVPVFRDDDGAWLDRPYHTDVLTAAAPNLRGLDGAELDALRPQAQQAIERRASLVLTAFRHARCTRLVLGAWGCGAFRNDPHHVARTFHALLTTGRHRGAFEEVVFAVFAMPWEETNLHAFEQTFAGLTAPR